MLKAAARSAASSRWIAQHASAMPALEPRPRFSRALGMPSPLSNSARTAGAGDSERQFPPAAVASLTGPTWQDHTRYPYNAHDHALCPADSPGGGAKQRRSRSPVCLLRLPASLGSREPLVSLAACLAPISAHRDALGEDENPPADRAQIVEPTVWPDGKQVDGLGARV